MACLIGAMAKQEGLLPFDRSGVARAIEHLARASGDSQRLSTQIEDLKDLAVQSNAAARRANQPVVRGADVQAALDERERRDGRARERVHRAIQKGDLLIDTDGEITGQVSALSVVFTGSSAFAFPTRVTANVRLGDGEVIDIQREVKLSGPIHSKGVMILESYLATRFSAEQPHCLNASLVFEQTYGEVEGDSASVAELCALLSAIGEFPLRQCLAVTGSVNQLGQVQPIGGVNEKIEGFFDVCRVRGLKGNQGVVIPSTNARHLMLRQDVREAVGAAQFHVYAVSSIAQRMTNTSPAPPSCRVVAVTSVVPADSSWLDVVRGSLDEVALRFMKESDLLVLPALSRAGRHPSGSVQALIQESNSGDRAREVAQRLASGDRVDRRPLCWSSGGSAQAPALGTLSLDRGRLV